MSQIIPNPAPFDDKIQDVARLSGEALQKAMDSFEDFENKVNLEISREET